MSRYDPNICPHSASKTSPVTQNSGVLNRAQGRLASICPSTSLSTTTTVTGPIFSDDEKFARLVGQRRSRSAYSSAVQGV